MNLGNTVKVKVISHKGHCLCDSTGNNWNKQICSTKLRLSLLWLPEAEGGGVIRSHAEFSNYRNDWTILWIYYTSELHIGKHKGKFYDIGMAKPFLKQNASKISWGALLQNQSYFCVVLGTESRVCTFETRILALSYSWWPVKTISLNSPKLPRKQGNCMAHVCSQHSEFHLKLLSQPHTNLC